MSERPPLPLGCAEADEWMMLAIGGELPEEASVALEHHLAGCESCRREWVALLALEETMASTQQEPSPALLAATRVGLHRALDAEAAKNARFRFLRPLAGNFQAMRAAPLAAAAMLLAGVGLGSLGGFRYGLQSRPKVEPARVVETLPEASAPIASVSGVAPQPDGKGITVSFNRLVPETATGSVDDPLIRRVLAMGVQRPTDPAVQDNSVRLLADGCLHGAPCGDAQVRGALMTAARYGGDPLLRSKALDGLEPFVAEDTQVRDAVLESVLNDASPAVREQAMRMLSPVEADTSVRQVLHNVSTNDSDRQVRDMSRAMSRQALDVGMQIQ